MKTIHKFVIPFVDSGEFELEYDITGCIVKIAMQNDVPCMWVEVQPGNPTRKYKFKIHGTGHEVGSNELYMDTFFMGMYVWHVYKVYD